MKRTRWLIAAAPVIVVIIFLAAMKGLTGEDSWICADGQWTPHGHPSAPMPQSGCGLESFDEIGNVVRHDPEMRYNALHFVYEKPRAPALDVELAFTPSSTCGIDGGAAANCMLISASDYGFMQGARAHVTGVQNGGVVTVDRILHVATSSLP